MREEFIHAQQAQTQYNQAISEKALEVLHKQIEWYRRVLSVAQLAFGWATEELDGLAGPDTVDTAYRWAAALGLERHDDGSWSPKEGSNVAPVPDDEFPAPFSGDASLVDDEGELGPHEAPGGTSGSDGGAGARDGRSPNDSDSDS